MPTSLLEEAYASRDVSYVSLFGARLQHGSFETPLLVVAGVEILEDPSETVALPIVEGGAKIQFRKVAFSVVRPGADRDGPTDARIRIDGAAAEIEGYLEAAQGTNTPLIVTFYEWLVAGVSIAAITGPQEIIGGLELRRVTLTEDAAEGTLTWPDGRTLNVPTGPNAFFDRDTYPNLFR